MRRRGLLHAELNRQVALLGHTDCFVIADCGLPVPRHVPLIDLAVRPGLLALAPILDAVLEEVVVQRHIVAEESLQTPVADWWSQQGHRLGDQVVVSHEELKERLGNCVFAIRTGEQTPYANVICEAGVPF